MLDTDVVTPPARGSTMLARASEQADQLEELARAAEHVCDTARDADLERLSATLRIADTLMAAAATMVAAISASGEAARTTGLPTEAALRLSGRRTPWDAAELIEAARAFGHMPATKAALDAGVISWSQARAIVREVRHLKVSQRAEVDAVVERQAPRQRRTEPEQLLFHVGFAVAELAPGATL